MRGCVRGMKWHRNSVQGSGIVRVMASGVDEAVRRANEAIAALAGHLAQRRSLLAWTMSWCPDGDASWAAIWSTATDAKSMINVLVVAGAIDRVAVRAGAAHLVGESAGNAIVRLTATCVQDGRVVGQSVRGDDLADLLRSEFARPLLDVIVSNS